MLTFVHIAHHECITALCCRQVIYQDRATDDTLIVWSCGYRTGEVTMMEWTLSDADRVVLRELAMRQAEIMQGFAG